MYGLRCRGGTSFLRRSSGESWTGDCFKQLVLTGQSALTSGPGKCIDLQAKRCEGRYIWQENYC